MTHIFTFTKPLLFSLYICIYTIHILLAFFITVVPSYNMCMMVGILQHCSRTNRENFHITLQKIGLQWFICKKVYDTKEATTSDLYRSLETVVLLVLLEIFFKNFFTNHELKLSEVSAKNRLTALLTMQDTFHFIACKAHH